MSNSSAAARSATPKRRESLLGSGTLYALATVAPILSTLLITPLITRMLGPTEYGVVGISITFYQMIAIVLGLGLSASITRHAIIASSGVQGAIAMVLWGSLAAIVLGTVLVIALPLWGSAVLADAETWVLAFPIVSAVGLATLTLCQSLFRAIERVKTFVLMGVLSAVAAPVFGLISILTAGPTAAHFLTGLAAGHLLAGAVALVVVLRIGRPHMSRGDLAENLRIGLPTVPHSVASAFLVSALVVFASHYLSIEEAGRLQLALLLGTAPLVLLGAFNNSWAPMIYRAPAEKRAAVLTQSTKAIAVLVYFLVAGFCVLAEPVISFIAGPELFSTETLTAAVITTIAAPFMALYLANIHLVFLSGRTLLLALTTPLSLVFALAGVLLVVEGLHSSALAMFALGLPLFHAAQWVMSILLRRRSGYPAPQILGAFPALVAAFLAAVGVAVLQPIFLVTLIVCLFVGVVIVAVNRSALRAALSTSS